MGFTFWVELGKEDCGLTETWGRNSCLPQSFVSGFRVLSYNILYYFAMPYDIE